MNVFVKLKAAGKRRPVLDNTPYALSGEITCLRQLIKTIVWSEVEKYNNRGMDNMLIPFLTEAEISDQSTAGKVGFGRLYSDKKADPTKAIETALLGFQDGLFRVLVEGVEVTELDTPLTIRENDTLTFIRLTFLAGRMW